MDPIRRRTEKPLIDTSYQQQNSTTVQPKTNTACDYRNDLLIAITPLLLVLLAFGGRYSMLMMCFGCLVCYIFDLLGSMEVNWFIVVNFHLIALTIYICLV